MSSRVYARGCRRAPRQDDLPFDPGQKHPLYWIASNLFNLSDREIRRRTGIPPSTLRSLHIGKDPKKQHLIQLRHLILELRDEAVYTDPPKDTPLPELKRLIFKVINHYLNHTTPADKPRTHRDFAKDFLVELLTPNPLPLSIIKKAAANNYIRWPYLRRIARQLNIVQYRPINANDNNTYWRLPKP